MVTFAVYLQVISYEFISLDDNRYVYANQQVRTGLNYESIIWSFTTFDTGNWHPVTWLSHILVYQFAGQDPGWHHLLNLVFHIANTILLFLVLKTMTGKFWRSAFVAALFALHPMHVESVAWISERKDVLSTFFWMLTTWSYLRYVETRSMAKYIVMLLFFILGLMSKPMLVTLPFVLLLLDFYPLNRLKHGQKKTIHTALIWEKIPLFALAAIACVITIKAQAYGGAIAPLESSPLGDRISNALVAYVAYMGKLIYPSNLAVLYPYSSSLPMWKPLGAGLLLISISFLAFRLRRQHPYAIVGWLWFLGTLLPVIGIIQVGVHSMADRYSYIPYIGLFIIIAWGGGVLAARWASGTIFISAAILISLAATTWQQLQYWRNSITLFQHAIGVTSGNWLLHNNLGNVLAEKGESAKALKHYREAIRINPDYPNVYYNLGTILRSKGDIEGATLNLHTALALDPKFAQAHDGMGIILAGHGRIREAIAHFTKAIELQPDFASAHNNLGVSYIQQGDLEQAITHFRTALKIIPDYTRAKNYLQGALEMHQRQLSRHNIHTDK
ncbi:Tetratricopeptide TPR_2 repeat protein [hydrothermal vent metagenome]|uniref:Tetratricopeptide TPR_2 repeat protein n=1 Tax=hydrothermal vent metagenome TaxID=652676 RepID=A0A3B1BHS6_9ZZZZ